MTVASRVVIVTGMSGAGKSTALHALEDLSFYCIDNLPTPLLSLALATCERAGLQRVALGVDVRTAEFLEGAGHEVRDLLAGRGDEITVLFLDAADDALLRRFGETRRPHPLSPLPARGAARALLDGITLERERLSSVRAQASLVIDTTGTSAQELRRRVITAIAPDAEPPRMVTRVLSFGFKYGLPVDADLVFDVRFLKNPYFDPDLRPLSGLDPRVSSFVLSQREAEQLVEKISDLLVFALPRFVREGRAYLTIAVGCTGGRHRSVAVAQELGRLLVERAGLPVGVSHRDVERAHAREPGRGEP
ncbi:MAG: RNase adapter RapZ [Polyangiaceae bacterium]|nr:RNase adapter RapZ [Polyangiaceae bacterium]